jgi:hypothetical protein
MKRLSIIHSFIPDSCDAPTSSGRSDPTLVAVRDDGFCGTLNGQPADLVVNLGCIASTCKADRPRIEPLEFTDFYMADMKHSEGDDEDQSLRLIPHCRNSDRVGLHLRQRPPPTFHRPLIVARLSRMCPGLRSQAAHVARIRQRRLIYHSHRTGREERFQ